MAVAGIVLERHLGRDRLLRLPIIYDTTINDPHTKALQLFFPMSMPNIEIVMILLLFLQ